MGRRRRYLGRFLPLVTMVLVGSDADKKRCMGCTRASPSYGNEEGEVIVLVYHIGSKNCYSVVLFEVRRSQPF